MRTAIHHLAAAALVAFASAAHAQAPAPAAPPEHTLTANVGLYSEYLFRGIAQTAGKPALQGGFDYAHASGFYAGTWASNASWLEDFGAYTRSSLEWDFYGGYKGSFGGSDVTYDIGTLYYYYPGKRNAGIVNADTWEIYAGVGWQWLSAKVSYSLKDYFGARPNASASKTDGTIYLEANAAYPVGDSGVTVLAHVGYLDVKNDGSDGDATTLGKVGYTDWRLGASYTVPDGALKGIEVGAYYSGNNAKRRFYTDLTGYDTTKDRGVVYVKKTF